MFLPNLTTIDKNANKLNSLIIHAFIQQIFIESLLCIGMIVVLMIKW